jgi:two-component system sensor histidine kinase VicK
VNEEQLAGLERAIEAPPRCLMANVKPDIANSTSDPETAALYLDAIVTSSDDAIVGKNLDGIIQSWNAGAERLFGYVAEEAIGKSIFLIIPPDRHHEEEQVLNTIRAGNRVDHFETVRMRRDGSMVDISLTVSPIKDKTGKIIGASKVARDISERRKADELKDQFLGLISHEMRTPLATVYGDSRILRDSFDKLSNDERLDLLDDLVNESGRLQRIIENLLLLTRLDAKGVEIGPLQIPGLVESLVSAFRKRHPDAHVETRIESGFPTVFANATYLELVLENLLGNSAKYSPPPSQIEVVARNDGTPEVAVLDRGIGFGPDRVEDLFTPFYRSEKAASVASGMGLGLAVCKRVVDAMGGKISARSRPGGGAEVVVSLLEAKTDGGRE